MKLAKAIEAVLFFRGEPTSAGELSKLLDVSEIQIREAVNELRDALKSRGLVVMEKEKKYALATAADVSDVVEKLKEETLSKDVGKAGLETLAILLYRGPSTRVDIDYIRGVNTAFTLRNLTIRGLAERIPNPKDSRSFLYKPSFELLTFLGISRVEELPQYEQIKAEVADFEAKLNEEEHGRNTDHT